jgi:hypothetical protein
MSGVARKGSSQKLNFLYNPTSQMEQSMFDCARAYKLVTKIAEIAGEMDWGYFDFHKLLNYLRSEEMFFGNERLVLHRILPPQ